MPHRPADRSPDAWREAVQQYIADPKNRPLKAKPLARTLGVPTEAYPAFREALREMLRQGLLALGPGRTVVSIRRAGEVLGTFRANRRGFGFIEVIGRPDVFVPRGRTHHALDGDRVLARLVRGRGGGLPPHGEIVRIVERAATRWVGVLERVGANWIVRPQGRSAAPAVQIDDPTARSARPGDLVVIEPLPHTLHHEVVRGVILERLGRPNETEAMLRGIIRRHGIPDEFPGEAREAAAAAAARFDPAKLDGRENLRDLLTITIDPPDARDFDDAISIEALDDGRVRLGVHIADVAHFVRAGDALDLEAGQRGNSVYLPRMVVPMLPEVLSNGVCSLQPGQPRLTKSVFITYDRRGRVVERRFANSLIRSHARLTYPQASAALEGQRDGLDARVVELLVRAEALAKLIRKRRLAAGMLVLSLPEVEVSLDDEGRVLDSGPAENSFSHTIIEMFMVEANEAVSRALREAGVAHLRRVHPPPAEEGAERVRRLAALLGIELPAELSREALQKLLDAVRGRPEEPAINYVLLRSLAQAYYAPSDEGHFALASEDYCHFTSPIRRYPDLVVHRALDVLLAGRRGRAGDAKCGTHSELELAAVGRRCSATERRAQAAERDAKNALVLQLMRSKLGQVFEGVVTGVAAFGAFVTIRPHLAEGLLSIGDLGADRWEYDEEWNILVARRSSRFLSIGQTLRVIAASIDDVRQELCFVPADAGPIGRPVRPHHAIIGAASPRIGRGRRGERTAKPARPRRTARHARDIAEKERRGRGR